MRRSRLKKTRLPAPHTITHTAHTQVYRHGQPLLSGSEYRSGESLTVRVEGRSGACFFGVG